MSLCIAWFSGFLRGLFFAMFCQEFERKARNFLIMSKIGLNERISSVEVFEWKFSYVG